MERSAGIESPSPPSPSIVDALTPPPTSTSPELNGSAYASTRAMAGAGNGPNGAAVTLRS